MTTLQALLRIAHNDLGPEQQQEFLAALKVIDEVRQMPAPNTESDAAKHLCELDAFEKTTLDYYREFIRRIASANIASGRWRVTNVEVRTL